MEGLSIAEIFRRVIIKSGQFLLRQETIELDESRFKVLVEDALEIYNKYCPMDRTFNKNFSQSQRNYTFSSSDEFGIPEEILALTPIRVYGMSPHLLGYYDEVSRTNQITKEVVQIPFSYVKPDLQLPFNGIWRIHAMYEYEVAEFEDEDTGEISFYIPNMTIKERNFLELVRGMFIQGIGRSRRAFTLNDLPIAMDSDALVTEGQEIQEKAEENIINASHKYHLAFGGGN